MKNSNLKGIKKSGLKLGFFVGAIIITTLITPLITGAVMNIQISFDGGKYGAAYAKGGKLVLSSFTEMEITAPSGSIVTKVEFDLYDFSKDANCAGYTRTPLVSGYNNGFCDADNWYATKKASYAGIYSYYSGMYSDFDTIQGGLDDLNVAVFSGIKVTLNGKTFKETVEKYNTKIFVLVPGPTLKENWKNELYRWTKNKYL